MIKRNKLVDYLATQLAKFLPNIKIQYEHVADHDYITLVAWAEQWEPKDVYELAYKQSNLDFFQTWDEWSADMRPLPLAVKTELQRALKIHQRAGNLEPLRAYAFVLKWLSTLGWVILWSVFVIMSIVTFA